MAYSYPESHLAWYIVGDRLALVTSKNTSSKNIYEAIDETNADGLLVEYSSEPRTIENMSDVPDCDHTIHPALVDYIKWRLFDDSNNEASMVAAEKYRRRWWRQVKQNATRDKIGGSREVSPYSLNL